MTKRTLEKIRIQLIDPLDDAVLDSCVLDIATQVENSSTFAIFRDSFQEWLLSCATTPPRQMELFSTAKEKTVCINSLRRKANSERSRRSPKNEAAV